MKKKNVLASLLLAGAMFLTACGGSASSTSAAGGVSGSFTGTAKGMGDVSVTLTLTDNVITDCTAKGDEETPGIGSVSLSSSPAKSWKATPSTSTASAVRPSPPMRSWRLPRLL